MTATERLRELLDERGVEWKEHRHVMPGSMAIQRETLWGQPTDVASGKPIPHVYHYRVTEMGDGRLFLEAQLVTPEQAIAATLGRGTCHYEPDYKGFTWWDENDVEHYEEYSASDECGSASCDKCGYTMMVGEEGWFDGWDEIIEWTEEDGSEHKGYILKPRFKFCPNCGKVVDE